MVACQITWGEDRLIIDAVQKLPNSLFYSGVIRPSKVFPSQMSMRDLFRASGPVGALQASAPLKRLGKKFGFAFGSYKNQDAIKSIVAFSRACQTARELKNATIGVLPYRCDQMTGTLRRRIPAKEGNRPGAEIHFRQ